MLYHLLVPLSEQIFAFNVSFDQKAMAKTFPDSAHLPWGPCLMRDANQVLFGNRKSIKLETAARSFGLKVNPHGSHRALADARLAGQVYQEMRKRPGYTHRV